MCTSCTSSAQLDCFSLLCKFDLHLLSRACTVLLFGVCFHQLSLASRLNGIFYPILCMYSHVRTSNWSEPRVCIQKLLVQPESASDRCCYSECMVHHVMSSLINFARLLQLAMQKHKAEQELSQTTISQLRHQQQQLQLQHHLDSQDSLSVTEASELTQKLAELRKQNSDLGINNAELSSDLGRALDVAQRVMEQKQALQKQCVAQQEQLKGEQQRVWELEGTCCVCS